VRLRRHQPTPDYMARRIAQGKSKNEVMRCLKRYIAREVFHTLQPPRTTAKTTAATWEHLRLKALHAGPPEKMRV